MASLLDGDYTLPQLAGPPKYEIPFALDPKPYIYKQPYWQNIDGVKGNPDSFLGQVGPWGGICTGLVPGSIKSIGGNVYEFEREFCVIPSTRNEYESFVWDYHLAFYTLGLPNWCIQGAPLRVRSRIQYDYFTGSPDVIALPRAFSVLETCLGGIILGTPPSPDLPTGTEMVAEDGTSRVWKPGIHERKIRYIKWIKAADLIHGGT